MSKLALSASAVGLCLSLTACVTPDALRGDFVATTPSEAASVAAGGGTASGTVRWGGTLLSLSNTDTTSCVEVLGRPLDSTGRPERSDKDLGRFIACQPGFKDPEVYKTGRIVTVVGKLDGIEQRKFSKGYNYRYAKLKADTVYLWQDQAQTQVVYAYDPFFNPYTYPYPFYPAATYYYYAPPPAPVAAPATALNNNALTDTSARRTPAAIGNVGNLGNLGGGLRRR